MEWPSASVSGWWDPKQPTHTEPAVCTLYTAPQYLIAQPLEQEAGCGAAQRFSERLRAQKRGGCPNIARYVPSTPRRRAAGSRRAGLRAAVQLY